MHSLQDIITPDLFFSSFSGDSKKRIFELISESIYDETQTLSKEDVYDHLLARERLGSTGIGFGVAIPHCRIAGCEQPIGAFFQLKNEIDFDAIDGEPVDLLFVLLVPTNDEGNDQHLQLLKNLAEIFNNDDHRNKLRAAKTNEAIYKTFKSFFE